MSNIEYYSHELYQKYSTFNMTHFIKNLHENGLSLTEEQLQHIDFSEESHKQFYLFSLGTQRQESYPVKESLALNLIKHLPLDYYKQYIQWDWLSFESSSQGDADSFIRSCLYAKKFDVISYFIKIGAKDLEKSSPKYIDFGSNYQHRCLNFLVNIGNFSESYSYTKEDTTSYLVVFYEALEQYAFIRNQVALKYQWGEKENFNPQLWFKDLKILTNDFHPKGLHENFLKSIFRKKESLPIFLDIIEQSKKDGDTYDLVFTKKNLDNSLKAYNNEAFTLLKNELLSPQHFQSFFETEFVNVMKELTTLHRNNYQKHQVDSSYLEHAHQLIDILETHSNNYSFIPQEQIYQLMTFGDDKLTQRLFKIFPHLYDNKTPDDYSISEVLHNVHHLQQLMKEYGITFKPGTAYPTPEICLHHKIYQGLSPIFTEYFLPVKDFVDDYIKELIPFVISNDKSQVLFIDDFLSTYQKYKLENNIVESESNKSLGIKGKI